MKLYHGTSTEHWDEIMKKGLIEPYLTSEIELAEYYADCEVDEAGGGPLILEVHVNEDVLRVDLNALAEPVTFGHYKGCLSELEDLVQETYDELAEEHPEWLEGDIIDIPENEYRVSLDTVASCWADETIPYEYLTAL